jgi:hypothetical protein
MPKFSVYVADELWDLARLREPHLNASQLVQLALRQLVTTVAYEPPPPAFARSRPGDAEASLTTLQQRFAQQARQRYEQGYRDALQLAETHFRWETLDRLAEVNWDLRKWVQNLGQLGDANPDYMALEDLFVHSEQVATTSDGRKLAFPYWHDDTWKLGFINALRDLWTAVRNDQTTQHLVSTTSLDAKETDR